MRRIAPAAAAIALLAAPGAVAQEVPWELRSTKILWMPTMFADMAIGTSPPTSTETSLLDLLDFGFMGGFEARGGRWGLFGEFNYLALSADASFPGGTLAATAEMSGIMAGAALAYRFHADDRSWADVFAGARFWSLDSDLTLIGPRRFSTSTTFLDPVVGLRGEFDLTERWFLGGLAEIGGFGLGSDFQWEVIGSVGYRWTEAVSLRAGWRHLALDLDDGGLVLDAALSGPFLALDVSFQAARGEDGSARRDVGRDQDVFPVSIVGGPEGCRFDADAARADLALARIGRNVLDVIGALRAHVGVQAAYRQQDRDGDGVMEFAAVILSSGGTREGLCWPAGAGVPKSPIIDLVARAAASGFGLDGTDCAAGPWPGYCYRFR